MAIIVGSILIIFGLGWTATVIVGYVVGSIMSPEIALPWYLPVLFTAPGVIALLIGVVFVIIGFLTRKKKISKAEVIYNQGIPARARVTFVDKNYAILLNNKPICSIIEFEFTDADGNLHTGRKDNVDSDLVIRSQMKVGSEVDIKYLAANPDENALILYDPREIK